MLFNNPLFFAFLILLAGFLLPGSRKVKKVVLLLSSYLFYGYWNWAFTFLLLWSTVIDYYCGLAIDRATVLSRRKRLLLFSVFNNLLILGFFKYFNFFSESFAVLLNSFGLTASFTTLNIVLPVGISFYTFQTMSYTIDIYSRQMKPTTNFIDFANYVSFFPQLVAGPIERASRLLPQMEKFGGFIKSGFRAGLTLMLLGYVKKVLISDSIAPLIDRCFEQYASLDSLSLCAGLVLFSLQIYFDFSGYSDIARGVAKLFGIELMINFNQPYFALNPVDFWRRWHISLSTWLRDYLFLPVAYRVMRFTTKTRFLNIKIENWGYGSGMFVTMFLGGLWHGAGWNFVLWGSLHGLYLVVYRAFTTGSKHKRKRNRSLKITHPLSALKMIPMYLLVTLTWLPFRAPDIHATGIYLRRLFDWTGALDFSQLPLILFLLLVMVIMDLPAYTRDDHLYLLALPSWLQNAILFSGFLAVAITMLLHLNAVRPFIYFQF